MRPLHLFLSQVLILAIPAFAESLKLETEMIREGSPAGGHWTIPRVTAIGAGPHRREWLMTLSKRATRGTDIYAGIAYCTTSDAGATWSPLAQLPYAARKMPNGLVGMFGAIVPIFHAPTGKVLVVGNVVCYSDYDGAAKIAGPRYPAYTVYDPATKQWAPDYTVIEEAEGTNPTSGYPVTEPDGTIFWPSNGGVVMKANFDGKKLSVLSSGPELTGVGKQPQKSGEIHLTKFGGKFYMAIRSPDQNRVSTSNDGQHYEPATNLCWEDGTPVPASATQMHWITARGKLHLVYARTNDKGTKVFRSRAPLWMAEFDETTLRVKKTTEVLAVPISPARDDLGNFGTTFIDEALSLITTSEFGRMPLSNSRVYLTRVTPK